jgi:hypothetical protein
LSKTLQSSRSFVCRANRTLNLSLSAINEAGPNSGGEIRNCFCLTRRPCLMSFKVALENLQMTNPGRETTLQMKVAILPLCHVSWMR